MKGEETSLGELPFLEPGATCLSNTPSKWQLRAELFTATLRCLGVQHPVSPRHAGNSSAAIDENPYHCHKAGESDVAESEGES